MTERPSVGRSTEELYEETVRLEERLLILALLEEEAAREAALAAEWAADYPKIAAHFETHAVRLRVIISRIRCEEHRKGEAT